MAVVLLLLTAAGYADKLTQPTPRDAFRTKTKSVAIFKDGYGFFLRQGNAYLRDGWCMTHFIPKATAGTFWLYASEPGASVTTVRSTGRNEVRFADPKELVSELTGKAGLQVKIETDEAVVEGELNRVLEDMLLVKSGKQMQIVQLANIKSVQILGQPLLMKVSGQGKLDQVTMNIGYVQAGIDWVPSYIAEFTGPDKLRLTLRGTITNGVEDLRDCTIYLVVGVPNFMMKGQLDPLTVHALGSAALGSMATPGGVAQVFRNSAADTRDEQQASPIPELNVPIEGLKELYLYELKGVDMSAGDVVMSTVMVGDVPCRSLYVLNADAGNEVSHYVILRNSLSSPLTTGPVMVLDKGMPVCQDQITYTSVGGECRVKLTVAGDVRAECYEAETGRRPQEEIMRTVYVPVEGEGKLTVFNRKKEAVDVEIVRTVVGKALDVSDGAQSRPQTKADDGLNPRTSLKWTIKVEPGKDRTVTYRYLRYIRASTG